MPITEITDKRICRKCGAEKLLVDFKKDPRRPSGRASICKNCHNESKRVGTKIYMRGYNRYQRKSTNKKWNGPTSGVIYLVRMLDIYKIGKTANLSIRFSALRASMPYPVELIHVFKTDDISMAEWTLFDHYSNRRLNGEWFQLEPEEVQEIMAIDYM